METAVLSSEQVYERSTAANHQTNYYVAPVAAPSKPLYKAVKRAFDVLVSLLGLAVLGIPMLLLALLIQLDSEGPAIFAQERLGKDGVPFTMYKFRTMRLDAEKTARNGPVKMTSAAQSWGALSARAERTSCRNWSMFSRVR